jgi:hypothetical protein
LGTQQTSQDTAIGLNTTARTANTTAIATNLASINSLNTSQTSQTSSISSNSLAITSINTAIGTQGGTIGTNTTNISTNLSSINTINTGQSVQDAAIALNLLSVGTIGTQQTTQDGLISNSTAHIGDATKHRLINDSGTSLTELFSANKIISDLSTKADLVAGKVPLSQLNLANVIYIGTWNATTNSPTLVNSVGTAGNYYVISVASTGTAVTIDGISDWQIGDWIIFSGSTWQKVDNTDQVSSVAGRQGAVVITTTDLADFSTTSLAVVNGQKATANGVAQLNASSKIPLNEITQATSTTNVVLGTSAGNAITTGLNNTFLGLSSGLFTTTGSNNTCLGSINGSQATLSSTVCLGSGALATVDNEMVFASNLHIRPNLTNHTDIGTTAIRFKDAYLTGTLDTPTVIASTGVRSNKIYNATNTAGLEVTDSVLGTIKLSGSDYNTKTNYFLTLNSTSHIVPVVNNLVSHPSTSTDHGICRYDGVTGKVIEDSSVIIDDAANITGVADLTASRFKSTIHGSPDSTNGFFTLDGTSAKIQFMNQEYKGLDHRLCSNLTGGDLQATSATLNPAGILGCSTINTTGDVNLSLTGDVNKASSSGSPSYVVGGTQAIYTNFTASHTGTSNSVSLYVSKNNRQITMNIPALIVPTIADAIPIVSLNFNDTALNPDQPYIMAVQCQDSNSTWARMAVSGGVWHLEFIHYPTTTWLALASGPVTIQAFSFTYCAANNAILQGGNFATASSPDITPPAFFSMIPTTSTINTTASTTITLVFNEVMSSSTITNLNSGTYTTLAPTGSSLATWSTGDSITYVATFTSGTTAGTASVQFTNLPIADLAGNSVNLTQGLSSALTVSSAPTGIVMPTLVLSNTNNPNFVTSATSEYGVGYQAWKTSDGTGATWGPLGGAFTGAIANATNTFAPVTGVFSTSFQTGGVNGPAVKYTMDKGYIVTTYSFVTINTTENAIRWILYGALTADSNYAIIDDRSGADQTVYTHNLATAGTYRYLVIQITKTNGATGTNIQELTFT